MRPIALRDETPPGDSVIIVRGRVMNPEDLRRTATRSFQELGLYLISVFGSFDLDVARLCETEQDLNRYRRIRTATVSDLKSDGFALIPTLAWPHFDVVLADLTDETLTRLDAAFGPPIWNPGHRATL